MSASTSACLEAIVAGDEDTAARADAAPTSSDSSRPFGRCCRGPPHLPASTVPDISFCDRITSVVGLIARRNRAVTVMGVESLGEVDLEAMSFADQAYLVIQDKLIMLDIRPNEAIVESELAAQLKLGRTPVREALKRLEADRLVVSFPRRGTFATGVDVADLRHISQIRVNLEPVAARSGRRQRVRRGARPPARTGRPDRRAGDRATSIAMN